MQAPASQKRLESRHRDERMLEEAVNEINPAEPVRSYFTRRYLEYVDWLEDGASTNLRFYYALRIPAIVLAALVPALVALNFGTVGRTITVFLGVVVAATTATSTSSPAVNAGGTTAAASSS